MVIPLIVFCVLALVFLFKTIVIIPQGKGGVKERLGRILGPVGPGFHILVPFVDKILVQSTGPEQFSADIGKVNVTVNYKVSDPAKLRASIMDLNFSFRTAFEGLLKRHLDGNLSQVSVLDISRIESEFQRDIADIFKDWGVEVEKSTLRLS